MICSPPFRAAVLYMFKIDPNESDLMKAVTIEPRFLSFFGFSDQVPDVADDPNSGQVLFECTKDAEEWANGTFCRAGDGQLAGDLVVKNDPVTMTARIQVEDPDVQVLDVVSNGDYYSIVWRRSRYSPFDGGGVSIRYCYAPQEVANSGLYAPVAGYKYHGYGNTHFLEASWSSTGAADFDSEGMILSSTIDDGRTVVIGGSVGWGRSGGYADITTDVGTDLRFVYFGSHTVTRFLTEEAFDECNIFSEEESDIVGSNFESPFTYTLGEAGVYYFGSGYISSVYGTATYCIRGAKIKVTVIAEAGSTETNDGSPSTSSATRTSLAGVLLVAGIMFRAC